MSSQPISPQPDQPVADVNELGEDELPLTVRIHVPANEAGSHRPTAEVLDELREERL